MRRELTPAQHEHVPDPEPPAEDVDNSERARAKVRIPLPGFAPDEDVGLGSLISKVTSAFGVKPCGGCNQRRRALDRRFAIKGRRSGAYRPPQ